MAPEYGATVGFFPVDDETLRYLRLSGRSEETLDLVERYCREQRLFRTAETPDPAYSEVVDLALDSIEASLAGPKRPQDRVPLAQLQTDFRRTLTAPVKDGGFAVPAEAADRRVRLGTNGSAAEIGHGAVVIAAITSCTNTSNPSRAHHGRAAGPQRAGARPARPSLRQDQPGPGFTRRHRLPAPGGTARAPGRTWLQRRRLRLHDLHRQQRPAARRGRAAPLARASWWPLPSFRGTATSRGASIRMCVPATWPRRRWSSPWRWRARPTST